MKILDFILDFVYPPRCPCCGVLNASGTPCDKCFSDIVKHKIEGKVCKFCGHEKRNCECKRYHYLFSGVVAPFYNRGAAQSGIYMLKFQNAPFAADYFGNEMYNCFQSQFPKVEIDVIAIVPSTKRDLKKRHYDKVELLARVFSKKLGVKLNKNIIKKVKQTKGQHDLSHNERQKNVKGAFKVTNRLDGKTVLLIDDIKTTGYTLNECAKQLRLAGAEKVYCVTALLTSNKSCKTEENNV